MGVDGVPAPEPARARVVSNQCYPLYFGEKGGHEDCRMEKCDCPCHKVERSSMAE